LKDAVAGKIVPKITLRDNSIYVGKHKVGDTEYATAIYSRKAEIKNVEKVKIAELKELNTDSIRKHLYCESTYVKYLVLAFYEGEDNEPVLMIQAAKNELGGIFSDKHLEAWMKYVGVMENKIELAEEIFLNDVQWVSQTDASIFGQCTGCWKSSCCRRAAEYMMGNTNIANCSDSIIAKTAPYMPVLGKINTATFSDNTTNYTAATYNAATLNYNSIAMSDAIDYIKSKLEAERPVLIGIHYTGADYKPPNNTTRAPRHFMVIVGYKKDANGQESFRYYDPSVAGTSINNKLIVNRQNNKISGTYKSSETCTLTEVIKTN
jgi:hypothetical protein